MMEKIVETPAGDIATKTQVTDFRENFWDKIGEHDTKISDRIKDAFSGLSGADDQKRAVLQSLERMEASALSQSDRQILEFVKQQFAEVSAANEERVKRKIESSVQNTMTELTFKVTNKINQGFEKLLSSQ